MVFGIFKRFRKKKTEEKAPEQELPQGQIQDEEPAALAEPDQPAPSPEPVLPEDTLAPEPSPPIGETPPDEVLPKPDSAPEPEPTIEPGPEPEPVPEPAIVLPEQEVVLEDRGIETQAPMEEQVRDTEADTPEQVAFQEAPEVQTPEQEVVFPEAAIQEPEEALGEVSLDSEPEVEQKEDPAPQVEEILEEEVQVEMPPEPDPLVPDPIAADQAPAEPEAEETAPEVAASEPEPVQTETEALLEDVEETPVEAPVQTGLFSKLKSGLAKTRKVLNTDVAELFSNATKIDEDLFDELEEILVTSDLGIDISMDMMERIRKKAKKLETGQELKAVLKEELLQLFYEPATQDAPTPTQPHVIMMVGVNGTGKTTTLGKLAMKYQRQGKKVLIAAADTFRAAAIEQVEVWADRAQAQIVKHKEGADPAAVAYDGVEAAIARGIDVVLIDTAGRLHTQKNLMEELKKIRRSVNKKLPGAPHEVMMVIDATTGQNAISQAKIFNEAVNLTQLSVTKLDGTAKGGVVAAVSSIMELPIAYIGVGESIEDLQEFDSKQFVDALFD